MLRQLLHCPRHPSLVRPPSRQQYRRSLLLQLIPIRRAHHCADVAGLAAAASAATASTQWHRLAQAPVTGISRVKIAAPGGRLRQWRSSVYGISHRYICSFRTSYSSHFSAPAETRFDGQRAARQSVNAWTGIADPLLGYAFYRYRQSREPAQIDSSFLESPTTDSFFGPVAGRGSTPTQKTNVDHLWLLKPAGRCRDGR
jgi:hypothetical protein